MIQDLTTVSSSQERLKDPFETAFNSCLQALSQDCGVSEEDGRLHVASCCSCVSQHSIKQTECWEIVHCSKVT